MQLESIKYKFGGAGNKANIKNPFSSSDLKNKSEKKRVLVIDDEPKARKLLKAILGSTYDVYACESVVEAENILLNYSCEIIITDYKMPGKTGLDLAQFVKSKELSISILMITGRGTNELSEQAYQCGVKKILGKPYNPSELEDAVTKLLEE